MLVALIVVATFNGLDVATRLSADQRRHDQAALLAAQSQEQLRSEPASALDALVARRTSYTKVVGTTSTRSPRKPRTSAPPGKRPAATSPKKPPTPEPTSRSARGSAGPSRPKPNARKSKRPASSPRRPARRSRSTSSTAKRRRLRRDRQGHLHPHRIRLLQHRRRDHRAARAAWCSPASRPPRRRSKSSKRPAT